MDLDCTLTAHPRLGEDRDITKDRRVIYAISRRITACCFKSRTRKSSSSANFTNDLRENEISWLKENGAHTFRNTKNASPKGSNNSIDFTFIENKRQLRKDILVINHEQRGRRRLFMHYSNRKSKALNSYRFTLFKSRIESTQYLYIIQIEYREHRIFLYSSNRNSKASNTC